MAVLSRVSAGVRTISATSAQLTTITAGEAIDRGEAYYISAEDGKAYLSDADSVVAGASNFDGYSLAILDIDEIGAAQTGGTIYLGAAAVEGMLYCASPTPGETEEATSSLVSGNTTTLIGYGNDDGNIVMYPKETGFTVPS